ncbi:MAG TPA: hypothetical protein VNR11_08580 [Xanthobacteraceae bacterium]|nr:hypothetical protein [Xanthobacteraceae bacterium]
MPAKRQARRWIGLLTAYAIALQAMLTAALLPAVAVGVPVALCVGLAGPDAPAKSGQHAAFQCCTGGVCHAFAGVAPDPGVSAPARDARPAAQACANAPSRVGAPAGGSHWARAPPV